MQWLLDMLTDGDTNIIATVVTAILSVVFAIGFGPIMETIFDLLNQIMDASYEFVLNWLYS